MLHRRELLSVYEHAPDADRGVDIPACAVAECKQDQQAADCSPLDPGARVLYGPGCLLTLPVPDFSMPYNVMCLVLIVAFIYLAGTWAFVLSWRRAAIKLKAA